MTLDLGLMGGIYAMFHAAHGVADYWLQTDWMAQNKGKQWNALLIHTIVYALVFAPIGCGLMVAGTIPAWKALALPFVVGIPHGWMDRRKFLGWFCEKTKGWKAEDIPNLSAIQTAVRVHVTIHMDQKFHYACLLATAAWLALGAPK